VTSGGVGANPDGFFPALAANAMGLEAFAATTIEEWQNQLRQGVVTSTALLHAAIHGLLDQLAGFASQIPLIGPLIAQVIMGFEGSLDDLAAWFVDLQSVLGNPTGLGTGSPLVAALDDIPLLGPIVVLVGQLIDAVVNALGFVGSGFSIPTLQTHLSNAAASWNDLVDQIQELIDGVAGAVGLGDVADAINGAVDNIQALIDGVGGAVIGDVVTFITMINDSIQGFIDLVTGAANLNDVAAVINGAVSSAAGAASNITTLISGLGGTVMADAVSFITAINTALQALKNALSGIFNPAGVGNVSLPNLVSQIQTGLQGILPAIVQNANGTASVLSSAVITLNSNGTATYNQVAGSVQTLVDQANGTMATVAQSLEAQAKAAIAQTGSNLTAAAAGVQSLLNSIFGGFGLGIGAAAPAATPTQATAAVVSAQQQLLDNAAGLAALNALLTQAQNGGGLSVSVNFTSYANGAMPGIFTAVANLPSPFISATPVISGGYLTDPGGGSAPGYSAIYNVATTVGDQQIISGVFSGVSGSNAAVLIGRANSAGTTYVRLLRSSSTWTLSAIVGGTQTDLDTIIEPFSNGAVYSLVCGTGAVGNRVFQVLKNGSPLTWGGGNTTSTEVGTTSQLGAAYRGGGVAVVGYCEVLRPGRWSITPRPPLSVPGSAPTAQAHPGWRCRNTGLPGASLLANSFFDTIEYNTTDITPALATEQQNHV
jgi:hypothetical protein